LKPDDRLDDLRRRVDGLVPRVVLILDIGCEVGTMVDRLGGLELQYPKWSPEP
jgi:hypothetical protein